VLDPVGQIQNATGIPPHIEHCILTRDVLETCKKTFNEVQTMTQSVSEAVSEAIEQKAASNGHLTFDRLQGMFESHSVSIDQKIQKIQEAIDNLHLPNARTDASNNLVEEDDNSLLPMYAGRQQMVQFTNAAGAVGTYRAHVYSYGTKLAWHVPKGFEFPVRCNLEVAWKLWLTGMPAYEVEEGGRTKTAPVRPFRKLDPKFIPDKAKTIYLLHWRPIFELLEKTPNLGILEDPASINADYLQDSFEAAKEYLKTRVEYVFNKPRAKPFSWEISTWSKHVSKSFIMRYGTENDKAHFPPEERVLRRRQESQKRKKPLLDKRRVRRRTANQNDPRLIVEEVINGTRATAHMPEHWQPDEMAAAQALVERRATVMAETAAETTEGLTGDEELEDFEEYARNLDASAGDHWQVSPVVQQQRAEPRVDTGTTTDDDDDSIVNLRRRLDSIL